MSKKKMGFYIAIVSISIAIMLTCFITLSAIGDVKQAVDTSILTIDVYPGGSYAYILQIMP